MLLGSIISDKVQIFIKQVNNNILCDYVSNNGITSLGYEQIAHLISFLFNTKKVYIGNENEYDVYIDENNYKRYYKNNIEDLCMFYLNNGENAFCYLNTIDSDDKKDKKMSGFKIYRLVSLGIALTLSYQLISKVHPEWGYSLKSTVIGNEKVYEETTLESFSQYIYDSSGLSVDNKNNLYNEDFLSFVLDNSDDRLKLYDFNERFCDINIEEFDKDEYPGVRGYYVHGTNCIHVLDSVVGSSEENSVETHEFIHMTQVGQYHYIMEALAEIMSYEFYDYPIDTYKRNVNRIRVLMEIIGPDAVLNSVYSYDAKIFKNSVGQYLSKEELNEFLELLTFNDWTNPDKTKENEIHQRIDELLKEMVINKYNVTNDLNEKKCNEILMDFLLDGHITDRIYFNNNKRNYSEGFSILDTMDSINIKCAYDENIILDNGIPMDVNITYSGFKKDEFLNKMKDNEFSNYILNTDAISIGYDDGISIFGGVFVKYNFSSDGIATKFCFDEEGNVAFNDKISDSNSFLIDFYKCLEDKNNVKIYFEDKLSFDEFKKIKPFLNEDNTYLSIEYETKDNVTSKVSISPDNMCFQKSEYIYVPSIYEKFECSESINKTK